MVADTSEIIGKTLSGHIELGVVGARNGNKQLSQVAVMDDIMRIVVPSDHRWAGSDTIPIDAIIHEPFVVREAGSGTLRSLARQLESKGLSIANFNIIAEMGSTEAIRQAIKNKIGISILSAIAVADDIQAGHLIALDVEGLDLKRSFYLTTHNQRSQSPLCRAFIDLLKRDISK